MQRRREHLARQLLDARRGRRRRVLDAAPRFLQRERANVRARMLARHGATSRTHTPRSAKPPESAQT